MKSSIEEMSEDFANGEFAHAYMEGHRASRIAAQIYALRKDRGWSQAELAQRAGIAQERVSKIESADFESLTLKTLYKFARAFDIDVKISFEAFSAGILDATQLSPQRLVVPERTKDLENFNLRISTKTDGR